MSACWLAATEPAQPGPPAHPTAARQATHRNLWGAV